MPFKQVLALSSGKSCAIFAYRIKLSGLASEMWCGSQFLPKTPRLASNRPMLVRRRFSDLTFSQIPGALTVKPMPTTPSCPEHCTSTESWHRMLLGNSGPTSTCTLFTDLIDVRQRS